MVRWVRKIGGRSRVGLGNEILDLVPVGVGCLSGGGWGFFGWVWRLRLSAGFRMAWRMQYWIFFRWALDIFPVGVGYVSGGGGD